MLHNDIDMSLRSMYCWLWSLLLITVISSSITIITTSVVTLSLCNRNTVDYIYYLTIHPQIWYKWLTVFCQSTGNSHDWGMPTCQKRPKKSNNSSKSVWQKVMGKVRSSKSWGMFDKCWYSQQISSTILMNSPKMAGNHQYLEAGWTSATPAPTPLDVEVARLSVENWWKGCVYNIIYIYIYNIYIYIYIHIYNIYNI